MDKCTKCGSKISYLDVLCPRCYALVEKVHEIPSAKKIYAADCAAKPSVLSGNPDGEIIYNLPRPLSRKTAASLSAINSYSDVPPAFNSYAGDDKPKPLERLEHESRSPSIIHGDPSASMPALAYEAESQSLHETPKPAQPKNTNHSMDLASYKETDLKDKFARAKGAMQTNKTVEQPTLYRSKRIAKKPSGRKRHVLLSVVIWLLTAGVLFGIFNYIDRYIIANYKSYNAFLNNITAGRINFGAIADKDIIISVNAVKTDSGEPAHKFVVSATGGEYVRLLPLNAVFDVTGGVCSFVVPDGDLAKSLGIITSADTHKADNIRLIVHAGNQQTTLDVNNIILTMPQAQYTRTTPSAAGLTTHDSQTKISFTVDKNSKVYVNQKDVTPIIDGQGAVSFFAPLEPGENYFVIDVYNIGYKTVRDEFVVVRK